MIKLPKMLEKKKFHWCLLFTVKGKNYLEQRKEECSLDISNLTEQSHLLRL